jgi:uncharacterized protein YlxW (UPF0749 family)
MNPSEQRWPAQQAPDDFADRVVEAGLRAARASLAEVELPAPRAPRRWFGFLRRPAVAWTFAAALVVTLVLVYFGEIKPEAEHRTRQAMDQVVAAQREALRQAREAEELRVRIAQLETELAGNRAGEDRTRAALKSKLAEVQAQCAQPMSGRPSARPATSRPACQCQPGDSLCSCL